MRVLFHAPLKPADHPDPSGDRTMARLLLAALERAGCRVEIASRLRMFDRDGDGARMSALADQARAEAAALALAIGRRPAALQPRAMFTYHVHYKAPDVVGPAMARALGIPYLVAEGSRSPRRRSGPWALGAALAEAALDAADAILVMNERDRPALRAAARAGQRLIDLPPFVDASCWPRAPRRRPLAPGEPAALLAVGMMRPGDKVASYRVLAEALGRAAHRPWTLAIAGDGPARAEVEAAFATLRDRVTFVGRRDHAQLADHYAQADLLVWPAVNEAYGMVFLEAALAGCPALAGRAGGVPGVVRDGLTGRLVAEGDAAAFADALEALLADPAALRRMGAAAERFAREERDLPGAAAILRAAILDATGMQRGSPGVEVSKGSDR